MILSNCRVPVSLSDELSHNSDAAEMYSLMSTSQRELVNRIARNSKAESEIKSLACDIADGCFPTKSSDV